MNYWRSSAGAARTDLDAALVSDGAAALEHLRDAALQLEAAIEALERSEAPEQ